MAGKLRRTSVGLLWLVVLQPGRRPFGEPAGLGAAARGRGPCIRWSEARGVTARVVRGKPAPAAAWPGLRAAALGRGRGGAENRSYIPRGPRPSERLNGANDDGDGPGLAIVPGAPLAREWVRAPGAGARTWEAWSASGVTAGTTVYKIRFSGREAPNSSAPLPVKG